MHGIINRGLQCFVQRIYGQQAWEEVRGIAGLKLQTFEAMLLYDDLITEQVLDAISEVTTRKRFEVLEDFGTFIVSEHSSPAMRRLLRLGGQSFEEFLYSLEDIHDRLHMALPDLEVPLLELEPIAKNQFRLHYHFTKFGYSAFFVGLLRSMADDYGSLVTIEHAPETVDNLSRDVFHIAVFVEPAQRSA